MKVTKLFYSVALVMSVRVEGMASQEVTQLARPRHAKRN